MFGDVQLAPWRNADVYLQLISLIRRFEVWTSGFQDQRRPFPTDEDPDLYPPIEPAGGPATIFQVHLYRT